MSALAGSRANGASPRAGASRSEGRRTVGGYIWFGLMLGGWVLFFSLLAFSDARLAGLYADLRGLPLLVEALVWFLTFPFTLALTLWESTLGASTRLALVVAVAITWSAMFFPRKRP